MEETRVNRYREYRQSFIKEGSIPMDDSFEEGTFEIGATTSTLPMNEVINAVHEEEKKAKLLKKERNKTRLKIGIKIAISIAVVGALIVLGVFAFGS